MSARRHLLASPQNRWHGQTGNTDGNTDVSQTRRGAAALDFALVLGIILPCAAVLLGLGSQIMQLVYEMLAVFLAWPFM